MDTVLFLKQQIPTKIRFQKTGAFLYHSTMYWKTKLNYKCQAKYVCICPGSALAGSCLVREWNITPMQINPPKAGCYPYYSCSHNFQLVQTTGRGYSLPIPKDAGYAHSGSCSSLYTRHEYLKRSQKRVNLFFLHRMLHLKTYVQKMCYSSTMLSRKQSHYRYQNENLHLLPHFGHGSSIHTKSSVQTWDTQQSPHFFFWYCESWVVPLQLIRAGTITGNKVLGLESPCQLDPFKRPFIF